MNARVRWGAVVVAGLAAGSPGAAQDQRVAKVLADWTARQTAVDAARYVVKGKHTTPAAQRRDRNGDPIPGATDLVLDEEYVLHLNLATGQYREEKRRSVYSNIDGQLYPSVSVETFDGEKCWVFKPREENAALHEHLPATAKDVSVVDGDFRRVPFGFDSAPYFFGHGIVAVHDDTIYPGHLRRAYDPDLWVFHAEAVWDDRLCVVVRTRPRQGGSNIWVDEYWTDPARGSAILRYVCYRDDIVHHTIRVEQQATPHGWFPKRWEHIDLIYGKKIGWIERHAVETLEFGRPPAEGELKFDITPGMVVLKVTHRPLNETDKPDPNEQTADVQAYAAGAGGRLRAIDSPFNTSRAGLIRGWPVWVLAATAAGAVAAGLAVWRVRRGRRQPT